MTYKDRVYIVSEYPPIPCLLGYALESSDKLRLSTDGTKCILKFPTITCPISDEYTKYTHSQFMTFLDENNAQWVLSYGL